MPVSLTEKMMRSPSCRADTRTSPRSVNLSALEMKLRSTWLILPSSVSSGGSWRLSWKIRRTAAFLCSGRNMPRRAPNRSGTEKDSSRTVILPASTLARSRRSSTSSESCCAALRMKPSGFSCEGSGMPAVPLSRSSEMLRMELMGVRTSWLICEWKRALSALVPRSASAFSSSSA